MKQINMPKLISKMPAIVIKKAVSIRFKAFIKMDKNKRVKHVMKMLLSVSELNNIEAKKIFYTRWDVIKDIKKKDNRKCKMITTSFQDAFSKLSPELQKKLTRSMSKLSPKKLTKGKEWVQFDSKI